MASVLSASADALAGCVFAHEHPPVALLRGLAVSPDRHGGDAGLPEQNPALAPEIRPLTCQDLAGVERHLLALDAMDRYARFGASRSDALLTGYVRRLDPTRAVVVGALDGVTSRIVGLAEAQPTGDPRKVEVAVSVHQPFRSCGLGRCLVGAVVATAFERGAEVADFYFDPGNRAIAGLVSSMGAQLGSALNHAQLHCSEFYKDEVALLPAFWQGCVHGSSSLPSGPSPLHGAGP